MRIRRIAAVATGAIAMTVGTVTLLADPVSADQPNNYGNCVKVGAVNPSDRLWGPLNDNAAANNPPGKYPGAVNAFNQSDGKSQISSAKGCSDL